MSSHSQISKSPEKPLAVLLPGGPGLSSGTLHSLDRLKLHFDLLYMDPPGTGGTPELDHPSFSSIVDLMEEEILKRRRPTLLIGHSYGGLYASELAIRRKVSVSGMVFLSVPLRPETYAAAVAAYGQLKTKVQKAAELEWSSKLNNETFSRWLATYGTLYFHPDNITSGSQLILRDLVSSKTFQLLSEEDIPSNRSFAGAISKLNFPKLMLAGENDPLFPPELLKEDASIAGANFATVPKASHFLMFDQPEAAIGQIETWYTGSVKQRSKST